MDKLFPMSLHVLLIMWFLLFAKPCSSLLPGGGTSLYLGTDTSLGYISNFTYLAGATSYSFEFWVINNSPYYQPATIMFSAADDNEHWVFYAGEFPCVTLWHQSAFPPIDFDKNWHHVAVSACEGQGVWLQLALKIHLRSFFLHIFVKVARVTCEPLFVFKSKKL